MYPHLCDSVEEGGLGFDYRQAVGSCNLWFSGSGLEFLSLGPRAWLYGFHLDLRFKEAVELLHACGCGSFDAHDVEASNAPSLYRELVTTCRGLSCSE